jgi:hypothetical protein
MVNVIYPKDPKAGGTWYVVDENGTVLVLLNGAEEKHTIKLSYRKKPGRNRQRQIDNFSLSL